MKVKSESEVAQLCPTPSDPMDCSLPGSSIHGIFQARVLSFVSNLRDNAFSFSPLRMMFAVDLSYTDLYYAEVGSLQAHFLESFLLLLF